MNTDFTPENTSVWIDNWKRKDVVGNKIAQSYFDSWPDLQEINVIVNHTSVTIEDFPLEMRHKIKLWPNVLRPDCSRGPVCRNINYAYIHTFLAKKKYCVYAHDSYYVKPGWADCIKNSDYDLYFAPQGDGFHVMTLEGLKIFKWWDINYNQPWTEIDYICRALRKAHVLNEGRASLVDVHGLWPNSLPFVKNHHLFYNSVGLENYVTRLSYQSHPQIGETRNQSYTDRAEKYHKRKWPEMFDKQPHHRNHGDGTLINIMNGPNPEYDDWEPYAWFDLDNLEIDRTGY